MKIGIDIRNIGKKRTGDETVFFNLVKNMSLIDSLNEYVLITDRDPGSDWILKKMLDEMNLGSNFKIVALGKKGINKFMWNIWTLPNYLNSHPVDIYHTQYITPFFVRKNIKIITTVHDVSFKVFPELIKPFDRLLLNILIPISIRRADRIIAVSDFTASEIARFYPRSVGKVSVIPNAIEADNLDGSPKISLDELRQKYGIKEPFILYLGTLQPRKNLPVLIRAYALLKKKGCDLQLVIAGGKGYNYDSTIDQAIRDTGSMDDVIFTGYVNDQDKYALMKSGEVFCFPSLYEGFGIPILEAFHFNLPVVASDIPPHREIAGKGAIYFQPNDSDDLADKVSLVINDQEKRMLMISNGKTILERFSWKGSAEKLLGIFQTLYARKD
jgi:glycosyltransferase involved in cell wall biosynthesis